MSPFPEHEVEIFQEYVSRGLGRRMTQMRAGLEAIVTQTTGRIVGPNASLAKADLTTLWDVLSARGGNNQHGDWLNYPGDMVNI